MNTRAKVSLAAVLVLAVASTAALGATNLLYDPGFEGPPMGDGWGAFGNASFNDFFGGDAHASLFGDTAGNWGGIFQQGIAAAPDVTYQFDLVGVRIESNWDADLIFGLEYYAADDTTKIGESLVWIDTATRLAHGQIDGNVFSMTGTAVAGTAFVRPIVRFENVNAGYAGQSDASVFIFNTYLSVAPTPGTQYLKNPGFGDENGDGNFGDYWGSYGTVGFNEFFGAGNPHASFFADTIGNAGGIYQQALLGTPGAQYRFDLRNVRIEASFDADVYFGLEYYGADDYTKVGETIVPIDTTTTGDGLSFHMIGTAVAGTVYVRPVVFFDNVGYTGGTDRNAFIFETSLTALAPGVDLLTDPGFEGPPWGAGWGNYGTTEFNDFWGGDVHACFYGDWFDNTGGIFQLGIPATPGATYQFDLLNTRIESHWDADLRFGLEYYAADDGTKLGETLVLVDTATRLAHSQIDGNVFSMTGTAVAGTVFVRPIIRFDNVNGEYLEEPQAGVFLFNTFLGLAPGPEDEHLKNPGFEDANGDGNFGDYWSSYGAASFNEFFGANNAHASLYADTIGNWGGVYQQAVLATPGTTYHFDLTNVRIEANFDADLYFGLEYYADDDYTKLGETIEAIDTSTTGDGLSFGLTSTAVAGAVYVRPIIFFDNVGTTGGEQRNAFIFAASLTEGPNILRGDLNCDGAISFADINPFVQRLTDPAGYLAAFPGCPDANGDISGNGSVGFDDINPFVALLIGG